MAKSSNAGWAGVVLVVLLYIAMAYITRIWPFGTPGDAEVTFVKYPGFGIEIPDNYAIHGIDVSRYQHRINWGLVAAMQSREVKIGFAFIKATEGRTLVDRHFERNWAKCRSVGMVRGAYHFYRANADAAAQARAFIKQVKLLPGDLPPVLDVESLYNEDPGTLQEGVALWLQLVEQHYGVRPIIYTNASFYNNYLRPRFDDYPLWVAHYKEKNRPRVQRDWLIWQHSETGRVDGINALVDFNVFNGDSLAFKQLLIGKKPVRKR